MIWYFDWESKHEFSAWTAEYTEIGVRDVRNCGKFGCMRKLSKEALKPEMVVVVEQSFQAHASVHKKNFVMTTCLIGL